MGDHDMCDRCNHENARCACPKNVQNPVLDPALVAALAQQVQEAIKQRSDKGSKRVRSQ